MACDAATQARLDEARKAYHALMTGTSARVVVDQNGERVEFTAINAAKLYAYIQLLDGMCAVPGMQVPSGPARFFF